jgi:prepilin-type N-terminal cleavage/methylation domain-containing protein
MLTRRPLGVTLIELTVVLAIVGVLGGSVGILLIRQQRFYRGTSELIVTRQSVRDAIEVLATDIRGMSVADTARLLADSALEFFSTLGSSIVCQSLGPSDVGLPPATPDAPLTSFASQPDTGDLALFYIDSGPAEARWHRHQIAGFSSRALTTACPTSSGFSRDADVASARAFAVSLRAPLDADIQAGTPVRFLRRVKYSLYHASDGEWYLGYRRCNAIGVSVCGSVQPLSGPYRGYSRNVDQSGLAFGYFDRYGSRISDSPLSLARVDVTAHAASRQNVLMGGRNWTPADSAHVTIAIRNRLR